MTGKIGFEIKVVHGNALKFKSDVLAVKYPQALTTLTRKVLDLLPADNPLRTLPPAPGHWLMTPSGGVVSAEAILMVGLPPRRDFTYDTIREMSRLTLAALAEAEGATPVRHLAVNVHGADWGFDEAEAFRATLFGFLSAAEAGTVPPSLERISVVENHINRSKALTEILATFLSDDDADDDDGSLTITQSIVFTPDVAEPTEPIASVDAPSIFVAMPFARKYDDVFYLALQPAVKDVDHLCIRLDQSSYTGDVTETIRDRIRNAKLVVALLDGNNPNVFLEVGYAWGVGVPTVLIVNEVQLKDGDGGVPFDVRSQRYLAYELLHELRPRLTDELRAVLKLRDRNGSLGVKK